MGKLLGLDLGTKTLGIAITNSEQTLAVSYENFNFPVYYYKIARERVLEICAKESIETIILGYPLNTDGTVGERARSSERFRLDLLADGAPPVILVNETYTTIAAYEELRALGYKPSQIAAKIDEVAAKYILETFLAQRSEGK
ncbi:MAG: Holliday junction resolvase RuvX [Bacilli bacterium]|jgi:putative Holliday junction resolvase